MLVIVSVEEFSEVLSLSKGFARSIISIQIFNGLRSIEELLKYFIQKKNFLKSSNYGTLFLDRRTFKAFLWAD